MSHLPKRHSLARRGFSAAAVLASAFSAVVVLGASPASAADVSAIRINEVESNNDSVHGDWIELYNTTGSPVVLTDAILSDNNNGHVVRIPATTLGAGAYYAIRVDDPSLAGNFGLGDADSARLFRANVADLSTGTPVDSTSWTTHPTVTLGRNPDGTGSFAATRQSTYAAANDFSSSFTPDVSWVVLNEIESSGGTPGDWIELYNTSGSSINIGGMKLSDSDNTHSFTIPTGTTIAAGGFYVVEPDVSGGFGLGADDAVRLYRAGATIGTTIPLDHFEWTAHATTTYGRVSAGLGDWVTSTASTKGATNNPA